MALLFRFVATTPNGVVPLVRAAMEAWLNDVGVPYVGQELIGFEIGQYSIDYRQLKNEGLEALEVAVESSLGESRRVVVQCLDLPNQGQVLIEETDRGSDPQTLLQMPSALTMAVSQAVHPLVDPGLSSFNIAEVAPTSAFEELLPSVDRSAVVPLVAVASAGQRVSQIAQEIRQRVGLMGIVLAVDSEELCRCFAEVGAIQPDAVLVISGVGAAVEVIPSSVVHTQPQGVVRRVQRHLLRSADSATSPPELREAMRALRLSGTGDTDWLVEAERLDADNQTLRQELAARQDQLELLVLETDDALRRLDEAERRNRYMERQLRELGALSPGSTDDLDDDMPEDISYCEESLRLAASQLRGLHIARGAFKAAAELDENAFCTIWAKKSWAALRALNDYSMSKFNGSFSGDFMSFCQDPPPGSSGWPVGALAMHESSATMQRPEMRRARQFEVPAEVNPTGWVVMEAHLKIVRAGALAPRLHFLDDSSGVTRKVHIGYLGHHLPIASS